MLRLGAQHGSGGAGAPNAVFGKNVFTDFTLVRYKVRFS